MYTESDPRFMQHALELGKRALLHAAPNPRVGCVIVRDDRILGEGATQRPGSNHAEIEALQDARRRGNDVQGATVYVTLEPCSHFGRTPPCATALIEARVARVVAAVEDPNPQVSGRGMEMLRSAGIDVRCGLLRQEAVEANIGFFSRMNRGRPWVRLKVAASLDGRTALPGGASQWITGEAARADGHAWRARACRYATSRLRASRSRSWSTARSTSATRPACSTATRSCWWARPPTLQRRSATRARTARWLPCRARTVASTWPN
jgi:diaminohydroxyphosphoribosylaminopyrimidine deaminase/5-amino-6-(5-phosphoribosylamino)uracil reductase